MAGYVSTSVHMRGVPQERLTTGCWRSGEGDDAVYCLYFWNGVGTTSLFMTGEQYTALRDRLLLLPAVTDVVQVVSGSSEVTNDG